MKDADGRPLADVEITLAGTLNKEYYNSPPIRTDAEEHYRLEGIYGGLDSFYLWAKKPGYGDETVQPIRMTPGENKTLNPLTLQIADGVIGGQVFETDGKPAIGARVSSQVSGSEPVATHANGRFRLTNVPRGKHYLVVLLSNTGAGGVEATTGQTDVTIKMTAPYEPVVGVVSGDKTGHLAPPIKVDQWVNAKPLDMNALKGKIVVVDFWSVTCRPCIEALPQVQALYEKYGKDGVVFIGMHTSGTPKDRVVALLKQKGVTYPTAVDVSESSGIGGTAIKFGPSCIPHLFVIGRDGKVVTDTNDVEDVARSLAKLMAR
ncbi:hypothetical protein BH11ARM2_BH11ARM2_21470 [soil metagenome]